ncbi:hypothetical protein [Streptomyces sp. NRRL B-24484]|uniref:hypothetical protein n=1 Tax=Streptomyces sp. NRRL B-24484 TaxID=1463833 RepID=UPI000A3DD4ED|nr:hypothetical protein [Streptomyces sp. NRRL B-24484]
MLRAALQGIGLGLLVIVVVVGAPHSPRGSTTVTVEPSAVHVEPDASEDHGSA